MMVEHLGGDLSVNNNRIVALEKQTGQSSSLSFLTLTAVGSSLEEMEARKYVDTLYNALQVPLSNCSHFVGLGFKDRRSGGI